MTAADRVSEVAMRWGGTVIRRRATWSLGSGVFVRATPNFRGLARFRFVRQIARSFLFICTVLYRLQEVCLFKQLARNVFVFEIIVFFEKMLQCVIFQFDGIFYKSLLLVMP